MHNPLAKFFRQYFNYSKRDRNATIVLIILIIAGVVINEIVKHIPAQSKYNYSEFAKELEELEKIQMPDNNTEKRLFSFNPNTISEQELDSLLLPDFVKRNLLSYRNAGGQFSEPYDLIKIYGMNDSIFHEVENYIFIPNEKIIQPQIDLKEGPEISPEGTFDPNNADKDTLLYFGFNDFQAENLISYREAGGKFQLYTDLLKIYGIDTLFLHKIQAHVFINEKETNKITKEEAVAMVVDLNRADSAQLIQLDGIGPTFASRILKYRDLLGGFYDQSQLLEVYNFPEETYNRIKKSIKIDSMQIKTIRINFAQYNELIHHPYLNNEQVNSILTYRDKNGAFKNVSELYNVPGVDSTIIKRISPYISYR